MGLHRETIQTIKLKPPVRKILDMSEVKCPYCNSAFKDKDDLSKHIDRVHGGSGLLEGDRRKW